MQSVLLHPTSEVCCSTHSNGAITIVKSAISATVLKHAQPSGQPCLACGSYCMILRQRCSSSLWQGVKAETDELFGPRGHLAASIQPDQSFTLFFSLPSDQALPVETLSCEVRGHTNSPSPSSFCYTIPSVSVHHALSCFLFLSLLCLPPSFCDTLAY